ncbi:MAG: hypothetical protein EXS16_12570 [Gemmataceae bacterium]|nr:hypothetical protein [Gemmataceae bacterium]
MMETMTKKKTNLDRFSPSTVSELEDSLREIAMDEQPLTLRGLNNLKVKKKFKDLIPPLSPQELSQLEENIKIDGCRDALVTWKNTLVDGHNRYEICTRNGIKFKTLEKEFANDDEACIWIIDNQRGRRNLPDIDRIMLANRRREIVAAKAKANQKAEGNPLGKAKSALGNIAKSTPVHTRDELAKAAGVGARTYDAGVAVLEAAKNGTIPPEVLEDVRRGRASISRVAKDIKDASRKKDRKNKRIEAAKGVELDRRIIVGDFREHADKISDGSVSLIFTDPPYDKKASAMLPALAEFAAAKLAVGGSLICYVGQTQLPAALDAFRFHLRYWWTIACVHSGKSTVMREYGINAGWKAVLWFVKETRDDDRVFVSDVMSGGEEKTHHDWQQSQSEAEYWIEKLCPTDGIVCDPFIGGGTTGAAASKLKREWIGFEIDPDTAKIASERCKK